MTQADQRDQQIADLQERLKRLSEAGRQINESLDLDLVLSRVLDSARALTDARYAIIVTLTADGRIEDHLVSGMTDEESQALAEMTDGLRFFEYLSAIPGPLRVDNFAAHAAALNLPEFLPPVEASALLAVPVRHQGVDIGALFVAQSESAEPFSPTDEDTLEMFASQVALVVANARRHREEQRARSDLETLINMTPVAVVVLNLASGAPASFNREARRLADVLGITEQAPPSGAEWTAEQLIAALTVRQADGREIALSQFPLAEALNVDAPMRADEVVFLGPDGRSLTALVNVTPIRSPAEDGGDGPIESVVVTVQDLTPIEEMERTRAEFLGMVSHELRTPLSAIRGSASTILDADDDLDPGEEDQFLRIIVDQADNMRSMIGDLLDVARIDSGMLPISAEAVEVSSLIDRARSAFLSASSRQILEIDIEPDLPVVRADRRRIVQVLGNLLNNAAAHASSSASITLRAEAKDLYVEFSVIDSGRRIPAEQLPQLFRKAAQPAPGGAGGQAAHLPGSRSGLGLAICKGIVESHGGRIWAESEGPGLGARFAFTLPVLEEAAIHRPPVRRRRGPAADIVGQRILVIDDDPHALRHIRRSLTEVGYEVIVTGDPDDAFTLLAENRPDLVLLDLILPGVDTIDLMRDIAGLTDAPVIFISAYGQDEVIARTFESGAADYIVKPFSPTELVARIRAALRRSEEPRLSATAEPFVLNELIVDYSMRQATLAGEQLVLTAIEFQLLSELAYNSGRVVTYDQLMRRVWGAKKPNNRQTLRTHMKRLRQKLGDDVRNVRYIHTQSRVGYRMTRGEHRASPIIPETAPSAPSETS